MSVNEFFAGENLSPQLYERIFNYLISLGPVEPRVTRSQICLRRRKAIAWVWMPGKYLHRKVAPLVLTFVFDSQDPSPRWKEIVVPGPGHFTHHLEVYTLNDIDAQVEGWLKKAWMDAA